MLVEVGVASEAGRGSVVATDEHPFWVASEKRWSNALDLKAGHRLETGDHRDATVTGTRSWSETRRVYNLTVDGDHTYYVLAGQTPVLTHNCDLTAYADSLRPKFHKDTGPFFVAIYTSPLGRLTWDILVMN
ncbi:polymorphic toxin-type HINT domain-containing protein [Amycolatopsis sp. NPDC052450]|uniref:polymorphic toxin-type HINT domain-containing protein n=1 Tax=Amycolatopsis sp. NPDC052450 TaxID=3363937 RepID=UPI0037C7B948